MSETTPEPIDLTIQTNGNIDPQCFRYDVKTPHETFKVSVIATSSTIAREGLKAQLPEGSIVAYDGVSTKIMQVQG